MTPAQTGTPSRARLLIVGMIFVAVVINYLDRSNISITVSDIKRAFGFNNEQMGLVLSGFGWSYAAFQIPGGWVADRVPPRFLYPTILILWSGCTALLGTAGLLIGSSIASLFLLRLAVGALEAPAYSINNQVTTAWFPDRERGSATGFYISGQFVGIAFLTPLLFWIEDSLGWRYVFLFTGGLGVVWGLVWLFVYRSPRKFRGASAREIAQIEAGGAMVDLGSESGPKAPLTLHDLLEVFRWRKLWGVYIGQFSVTTAQWFFLTWFPTYLKEYRHFDYSKLGISVGLATSLPFVGAFLGVLFSGFVSDRILRAGASLGVARKTPIIIGLLLSCSIIGANFVDGPWAVIGFMTLAFFGNGMASIGWSIISSVAPPRLIGLTGGAFNGISNISGIVTPYIIGALALHGNFAPGLVYVASVALIGACCYIFVIGKIEQVGQ
jgi:ACS family D-galactonate transporter-like MFS transporter